jgi:tripartite-type tricarboxylate transporter receptor subunit TctC
MGSQTSIEERRMNPRVAALAVGLTCLLGTAGAAHGQVKSYPERPIRLIVPYPPGGANDILARMLAARMSESWGHQVVIDNRGGSAGTIGATLAARSSADGYTLLMGGAGTMTINGSLKKLPFDTLRDFNPLAMVASLPMLVSVHPSVPAHSVKELVAVARAKPGALSFMSPGSGTPGHLAGELFKRTTQVDMLHVPYKGGAAALNDLLAGQIQLSFYNMAPALPHVRAGRLRGIAVTGEKRSPSAPEFPTVIESGVPGFVVIGWWGVFAPAATPQPIARKLADEIVRIFETQPTRQQLIAQSYEPAQLTGDAFRKYIAEEIVKWAKVIEASGARAD